MSINAPIISVLMPMYNSEAYISEAVESILNQTISDFEFIIVDDASTDNSVSIVKNYNDPRIILIEKPVNTGYAISLNMGLSIAKGKYIARMDSDDISVLIRFEKQLAFMEANPDIAVCGSWYKELNSENIIKFSSKHDDIKIDFLSFCAIGHPTAFIRNTFLQKNQLAYDIKMEPAEDYDLWCKICLIGKLANIEEVLLNYRFHELQVSNKRKELQMYLSKKIQISLLKSLCKNIDSNLFIYNVSESMEINLDATLEKINILNLLIKQNNLHEVFNTKRFNSFIKKNQKRLIFNLLIDPNIDNFSYLLKALKKYKKIIKYSGIFPFLKFTFKSTFNLIFKSNGVGN